MKKSAIMITMETKEIDMSTFRVPLLSLIVCCGLPIVSVLASPPLQTDPPSTILLVDDHHILYRSGTKRVLHPLKRHEKNPMLAEDKPWETTIAYCSVYRNPDTGAHQLWYQAFDGNPYRNFLCYAESRDGINWVKPNMGLCEYKEVEETNILLSIGFCASVIFDPRDPDPYRRYKLVFYERGGMTGRVYSGLRLACSPDGIHWTKYPESPIIRSSEGYKWPVPFEGDPPIDGGLPGPPLSVSDVVDLIWDPMRQVYAIYSKTWIDGPEGNMHWKRAVVRTDSKDFIHWTKPQLIMTPDEFDGQWGDHEMSWTAGGGGSEGVQLHSGPAFYYNNMYFSMLQVMDSGNTGNMPIELALSHDGYHWERPFRHKFFLPPLEDKTKFDASVIWSNATPVFLEDEFRFYYGAYGHGWNSNDYKQIAGIGLATMERDRFAGVRPIENFGQITFKPLDLQHVAAITLNGDATGGTIRAEIMNEDGYRVRGFSRDDAIVITGDSLRHRVAWKDRGLSELPAGRYKIRLHLENAEVFALTLREALDPLEPDQVHILKTKTGVRFGLWGKQPAIPAPTILNFNAARVEDLGDPYYRGLANILAEKGYLCVSMDYPCYGLRKRPDDPEDLLRCWRHRIDHGKTDFIDDLNSRTSQVLDYLIEQGYTDPQRVAACGRSSGGFSATHYTASDPRVKCVAILAPVTDLAILQEFHGIEQHPLVRALALSEQAENLADRAIWIAIGDRDKRVGTDSAIDFARKAWQASMDKNLNAGLELHVLPEPRGHTTPDGTREKAAAWILNHNK